MNPLIKAIIDINVSAGYLSRERANKMVEDDLQKQTAEAIRKADNQRLNISLASNIEAMNNSPVLKDKPDLEIMEYRRRILGSCIESLEALGYDCGSDTQLHELQFDYDFLGEKIEQRKRSIALAEAENEN